VTAPLAESGLSAVWKGRPIDADVHVTVSALDVLRPYLKPHWLEFVNETGFQAPPWTHTLYPPGVSITAAARWRPADGRPPASDLCLLREHVLDPDQVETAILNCYWGLESIRHPDFALGLAQALNDWIVAEWLDKDPRLRASIVVPGFVPDEAASEIDRVGAHPGFVQVLMPVRASRLYGQRPYHPVFEAIERNDLVAGIHYGGTTDGPPTPSGYPSWFMEEYTGHIQAFQAQILSLIGEGVFEKFPRLRVSLLECGFAWLGPLMWRADKEWKGLRRDVPWVKQPPSQTIRERIKISTQPLDTGPPEQFKRAVEWLGSDELLMYASDYPHDHGDDIATLLAALPQTAHEKVMATNARTHYRL
jgi:predicted TIM-barrel fold metal-dependent hydrolase